MQFSPNRFLHIGFRFFAVLGVCVAIAGCSPYRLQGVVVAGSQSGIEVVKKNDPRLSEAGPGVPGVSLDVFLDPERLSPRKVGEGATDAEGGFALSIDEPGAGLLMLDIELRASRSSYATVTDRLMLPGSQQRVIITLKRGQDLPRLESGNVLEDTLRDAKPYLRD